MRWLLVVIVVASWSSTLLGQEVQVLEFPDFTFESGTVIPQVKLAYTTRGALNEQKSNAILLPSHYGADHTGYDYLIGPGKELDPAKYFLILTNLFANGVSSSPSNTPNPFRGPRFPQVSIRDNVEAQHRLVREKLGISKLKAIVGFSMGGQQAYQWAVSHPQMMESIVVICGNAKQYPFGIVRLQGSIKALKADAEFKDGLYTRSPEKGLRAMSMHYRAWTRSPEAWPRDLFDNLSDQELEQTLESLSESFLTADANNLLSQAETWKRHDVGDTKGFGGNLEKALGSIQARVLLLPSTSDQYFPLDRCGLRVRIDSRRQAAADSVGFWTHGRRWHRSGCDHGHGCGNQGVFESHSIAGIQWTVERYRKPSVGSGHGRNYFLRRQVLDQCK